MVQGFSILFLVAAAVILPLYVFNRITWKISDGRLVLKWKILMVIPITSLKLDLDEIEEVRTASFSKDAWFCYLFINGLRLDRAVLMVFHRRRGFFKKVFVTPEDPSSLIKQIRLSQPEQLA